MKKFLIGLMSLLMVLTVGMTVSASVGPTIVEYATNIPGKETSSVISNYAATKLNGGERIEVEAKDVEGYEFSHWSMTIYSYEKNSNLDENTDKYFDSITSQKTTFTVPEVKDSSGGSVGRITVTANFKAKDNVTVISGDNISNPTGDDAIGDAVKKQAGIEVSESEEIVISAVVESKTTSDDEKAKIRAAASASEFIVADESVAKDIKLSGKVIDKETKVEKNTIEAGKLTDLGEGTVTVTASYEVSESTLTGAPEGYERRFYVIALHEDGTHDIYPCSKVDGSVIEFTANKFSTFSLAYIDAKDVKMYRLYNPNSGEHFYTSDLDEKEYLVSVGWKDEGIGWTAPSRSNTPVYRLYSGTDHHYTTSIEEKDMLVQAGWKYEDIGWYSDDTTKGKALYRQFNPNVNPSAPNNNSGSHNYTTSLDENNYLVSVGWRAEGIGWYGLKR